MKGLGAVLPDPACFRLGLNYWPSASAMGWWRAFDRAALADDFARIASAGFDSVRIFLGWEDFQPTRTSVDARCVDQLVGALDQASAASLRVMPTLFCGHMSGVNWIPAWALGADPGDARFRIVAGARVVERGLANWYSDGPIQNAQVALARELAGAVAGHGALWAWDLGNENSNCTIPPSKAHARDWLRRVSDAIRSADSGVLVTLGLHMEDLENDRNLGPREAALACDFLTMHGYPGYASWSEGATDEHLLPFLARITRWLGGGLGVLFSEFGVPTMSDGATRMSSPSQPALVSEAVAADYVARSLEALLACGATGAMLWCYADYARELWQHPPLDLAVHERSFGLWRADQSPKAAVAVAAAFAARAATCASGPSIPDDAWLDIDLDTFHDSPGTELRRLYRRYRVASIQAPRSGPSGVTTAS